MSAGRTVSIVVLAIGGLLLLAGLSMPATQTQTAQTCVDSALGYGQSCVESSYRAPTAKGPVLGGAVTLMFVGGILWVASSRGGSQTTQSQPSQPTQSSQPARQPQPSQAAQLSQSSQPGSTTANTNERKQSDELTQHVEMDTRTDSTGDHGPNTLLGQVEAHRRHNRDSDATSDSTGTDTESSKATSDSLPNGFQQASSKVDTATTETTNVTVSGVGTAAGISAVGGLVISSVLAAFVGSLSGAAAWLTYLLGGLASVAVWHRYSSDSELDSVSPSEEDR
ncbi:hypothetical protein C440_13294 [Haloferax mucosum ATCC BAA-1512]|uniref:Uncharacterized protein n=1 Tax=Haloferax mucosum ATCC BAA-1512 TaxID=662479 RepID=M0I3F8_9EURY|nr:hypothetical protein [Haloferax mucosum]ELZ91291.1 hypothetical protein C440_13294 [Haloferax mucosum ATCC BAA-1512]